jgi:predicted NUDIX family NTP pyrophosphohydrolase
MGGPYWSAKDAGAWSIPKGEPQPGETDITAARREYAEEIGAPPPNVDYELFGEFRQTTGKLVTVFVAELTAASSSAVTFVGSNDFDLEWPPRSGTIRQFPEMDRAGWFPLSDALDLVVKGQVGMIESLIERLGSVGLP